MDNIAIILAAGNGTRMNSNITKVLHKINNKPMIIHLIEKFHLLNLYKIIIVVNKNNKNSIVQEIYNYGFMNNKIQFIIQNDLNGTGGAIKACASYLKQFIYHHIIIINGDNPLIKIKTIKKIMNNKCNIVISKIKDPTNYGRVLCHHNNKFLKIIEEKDCLDSQKNINIINVGIYSFPCYLILKYIHSLSNKNKQNEFYLTDLPSFITREENIHFIYVSDSIEIKNINTQNDLNIVNKFLSKK